VLVWKSNLEARNSTDNRTLQESFSVSKLESPKSLKPSRPIVKIDESPIRIKKMNKRVGELERSRRCNCCGCTSVRNQLTITCFLVNPKSPSVCLFIQILLRRNQVNM
ncbi:unnamed protein product, partial [Nesidiocoris tenuis]